MCIVYNKKEITKKIFPSLSLLQVKEPKVHILGSITNKYVTCENWPGCLQVGE